MFKTATEKADLNQISLTGTRAVILLGMLMIAPRSMEEIRKAFISYKVMDDSQPEDTIRIDINTLKHVGCEISRSSQKTDFKYELGKHPFALNLSQEDLKALKKVYGEIKKQRNIGLLIEYHLLFNKIAKYISTPENREELLGISELKRYSNLNILKELIVDCAQGRTLTLTYSNPATGKSYPKTILAQKLDIKNDKIYLYGFDPEINKQTVLSVSRIKQIISKMLHKGEVNTKTTTVKFELKNMNMDILADEEVILEASDDGYVIEGNYFNEFYAMQRVLSFGSACTVIEPVEFKNKIIAKLKEMRNIYGK